MGHGRNWLPAGLQFSECNAESISQGKGGEEGLETGFILFAPKFEDDDSNRLVLDCRIDGIDELSGEDRWTSDSPIRTHSRSITVATPIPSPVHMVATPRSSPRRSSSSTKVPSNIAPVAPTG